MPVLSVTTSSGASPLLAYSALRRVLFLQNNSDTDIYVRFTGEVSTGDTAKYGLKVAAGGGTLTVNAGSSNDVTVAVYAIHGGSGTKQLVYEELNAPS